MTIIRKIPWHRKPPSPQVNASNEYAGAATNIITLDGVKAKDIVTGADWTPVAPATISRSAGKFGSGSELEGSTGTPSYFTGTIEPLGAHCFFAMSCTVSTNNSGNFNYAFAAGSFGANDSLNMLHGTTTANWFANVDGRSFQGDASLGAVNVPQLVYVWLNDDGNEVGQAVFDQFGNLYDSSTTTTISNSVAATTARIGIRIDDAGSQRFGGSYDFIMMGKGAHLASLEAAQRWARDPHQIFQPRTQVLNTFVAAGGGGATNPHYVFGHPLYGPFAGPIG